MAPWWRGPGQGASVLRAASSGTRKVPPGSRLTLGGCANSRHWAERSRRWDPGA
ncbi:MAG: hypothetical protein AVDCRST_MAG15-2897 [uncultured Rubellimicrobium sp.]|uniref:Uncharacterized protein n=1 Tax=uncultured Rubellimicrobium sp. TaxID=543078 RepID=A0A6J4Q480_9RHOB|nr:MAG: hypothetical protein AVDCRST_MAG15-2897 [uncultured Rubellimicrobium sp.]